MAEVVNISGRSVTVLENGVKMKYAIARDAMIRINGEPGRVGQLEPGDEITLSGKGTMGFKNIEVKRDQQKIQKVAEERNKVVQGIRAKALEEVMNAKAPKTSQEELMVAAAEARNKQELPDRGGDNEGRGTGRPPNAASQNDNPSSPSVKRRGNPSEDLIPAGYPMRGTDADKHNQDEAKQKEYEENTTPTPEELEEQERMRQEEDEQSNSPKAAKKQNEAPEPEDEPEIEPEDDEPSEDEDLEALTIPELKDTARKESLNLHGATTKADIIKAIKKGRKE